jgi:hypothetical protein
MKYFQNIGLKIVLLTQEESKQVVDSDSSFLSMTLSARDYFCADI